MTEILTELTGDFDALYRALSNAADTEPLTEALRAGAMQMQEAAQQ